MRIDMHVHPDFYEPINEDPEQQALRHRVLDIHKNGLASLEHIENQMRCGGLDRLVLLPQDTRSRHGRPLVSNQEIKALVDLRPHRFIGFASVDPLASGCLEELERAFMDLGLRGLKLNTAALGILPGDERLEPVYQLCERYNRPILFHSGMSWEPGTPSDPARPTAFEPVAMGHPKLRFCLGHFGWPWVRETAMLLLKNPNVYADTGILYFDSALEFFRQTFTVDIPATWIDRSLRHQVLFGSNNPRFEQIRMVQAVEQLGFRDKTVELIMGGNALEFLGEE